MSNIISSYKYVSVVEYVFGCSIFLLPLLEWEYITAEYNVMIGCLPIAVLLAGIPFVCGKRKFFISVTDVWAFCLFFYMLMCYWNDETKSISYIIHLLYAISLYVIGRNLSDKGKKFLMCTIVLIGVFQSILLWLQYLQVLPSSHAWFCCIGTYSNPALCASMVALAVIVDVYILMKHSELPKRIVFILFFSLILMMFALILTNSRAAWLSVIFVGTLIVMSKWKWNVKKKFAVLLVISLLILPALYLYKQKSADSRLFIWRVCMEMVKENPLFGNGAKAVERNYMHFQADVLEKESDEEIRTQATNNACSFNEYLRVLCEYGVIGIVLFAILLFHVFQKESVWRYLLMGWLIIAFFSYPSGSLSLFSLLVLFVGVSSSPIKFQMNCCKWIVCSIMCGIWVLSSGYWAQYKKTDEAIGKFYWDEEKELFLDSNYHNFKNETELVSKYARALFLAEEYDKAIPVLEQLTALSPTSEIYCDLGLSYQYSKQFDKAEECYKYAAKMVPGFITPSYRLFKLYVLLGDERKTIELGRNILNMPLKITNKRTETLKEEVKSVLDTYQCND